MVWWEEKAALYRTVEPGDWDVPVPPAVLKKLVACARALEHYSGVPCPRVDHDQCADVALSGLVDSAAPRATPEVP